ncbi:hypothetical protein LTR66_002766 [Elasticomyces elasticus]|nr:hypothetical protein LTR66_002766 [Elasticomyces elasticus]KAK5005781.1 hypothetical protein LTR28_007293 [Elasticomyces elasticus]
MPTAVPEIQLLQASIDKEGESHFRFLIDNKSIKYIVTDAGLYSVDDMCFAPALIPLLPVFPTGNWNDGHIARNSGTGQPCFARVTRKQLPSVSHSWHATRVDYLELAMQKKLRSKVYEATSARFDSTVVAKFARFFWEIPFLNAETVAYQWIEGRGIAPEFLGHLTEEGRVIGFLMERITDGHHASPKDLSSCQEILSKLHRLGIKHGDINKHNFIIHDGRANLLDFECARKCEDREILGEEFEMLAERLGDTSGRGGSEVVDSGS